MRASRPAKTSSYREYFRKYRRREGEATVAQLQCAVHFLSQVTHAGPSRGVAADLGCGTGQIAIALARDGWRVVGVDECSDSIAIARRLAARERCEHACFNVASIEQFSKENFANLALLWGGILGYQPPAIDRQVVHTAARSLVHGGTLVVMLFNPTFFAQYHDSGVHFDPTKNDLTVIAPGGRPVLNVAIRTVEEARAWSRTEVCGEEHVFLWDPNEGELPIVNASDMDYPRHRYLVWTLSDCSKRRLGG
jgi:SAM-dependent methyltransferase